MQNKIAFFRKQKGLTQEKLAEIVGITRPYLSEIENGNYAPGGPLILKIAKSLGVSVEDIFSDDNRPKAG